MYLHQMYVHILIYVIWYIRSIRHGYVEENSGLSQPPWRNGGNAVWASLLSSAWGHGTWHIRQVLIRDNQSVSTHIVEVPTSAICHKNCHFSHAIFWRCFSVCHIWRPRLWCRILQVGCDGDTSSFIHDWSRLFNHETGLGVEGCNYFRIFVLCVLY